MCDHTLAYVCVCVFVAVQCVFVGLRFPGQLRESEREGEREKERARERRRREGKDVGVNRELYNKPRSKPRAQSYPL